MKLGKTINKEKNNKNYYHKINTVNLVLFILIVFLFLQWKFDFFSIPYFLKIFLISCFLIFPSGYLISNHFFSFTKTEKIVSSFVLGYTFFSIISFFAYLFSLKLTTFLQIFLVLNLVLFITCFFINPEFSKKQANENNFFILSIILIIIFFISIHYGSWISGDAIIHIPKIRQIVELNKIEYQSFFVKGLYVEQRGHNPIHPLLATISLITHLDCFYVWIYIITLLAPIKFLSYYISTKIVFGDKKFAIFSSLVLFLVEGVFNIDFFKGESSPFWLFGSGMPCVGPVVLNIFLPYILFLVFKYLQTQEKKFLLFLSLVSFAISLTHMMYYLYILFAIFSFLIFSLLFKKHYTILYKKIFMILIFLIVPSFFYTFYMTNKINHPIVNPAFKSLTGEISPGYNPIKFLDKEKKYPIVDPFIGIWPSIFAKISFLFLPLFLLQSKISLVCLYISSVSIFPLVILLNPILLHFLMPIHPPMQAYYVLVVIIPYTWMFTYILWYFLNFVKNKLGKIFYYLTVSVGCIYIFLSLPKYVESLENINFTSKSSENIFQQYKKMKDIIDLKIPYGSVVVMEKNLLWYWPVFFSHFPLTHPNRGLLPPNYNVEVVDKKIGNLLANPESEESLNFVKQYSIDYLVLQKEKIKKDVLTGYEKVLEYDNLVFYKPIY
jgi:hypothetical protein